MPRSDALATLYFFQPLRRVFSSPREGVPILMYHAISDSAPCSRHPYFQTATSPRVFAEHMRILRDSGYSVIGLGEASAYLSARSSRERGRAGTKPVVITFDDGYRNFLTEAFPVMSRYGFSATVFLPTGSIGSVPLTFQGYECLTWSEIRGLRSSGIEFGSHSATHPQLRSLRPEEVAFEVRSSKESIEERLGCAVQSFSYPYAFPEADRPFRRFLRQNLVHCGYTNGVSTVIGTANREDDKFFRKRLPVNSSDDRRLFLAKLAGGYDWLHSVQYASKLLRKKTFAKRAEFAY